MENKNKEKFAKTLSLMERVEHLGTYTDAIEREKNLISEAVQGKRVQVTRDEMLDLLNKMSDDPRNNGKFVSFTYVMPEKVYKTKRSWRPQEVTDALNAHEDRSEEEWHKNLTAYNQDGAKGNNPISAVVVAKRYRVNWITPEKYNKRYGEMSDKIRKNNMEYGIGLDSDGLMGDNHNQRQKTDWGQFNQTGKLSFDLDMKNSSVKTTAYFTDGNGHIITDLPADIVKSMTGIKNYDALPKYATDALSGPVLDAWAKGYREAMSMMSPRNFKLEQVLCLAAGIDGVSYYFINDKLNTPIADKSDTIVSQQEMLQIAKDQLGESFDEIQGFAN